MKLKFQFIIFISFFYTITTLAQCDVTATIDMPNFVNTNSGPVNLAGSPAGGVFSGNGVFFNAFNPIFAGVGVHEITYTYTDPNTGCVYEASSIILVFTVVDVFVSYGLGTIQPKLGEANENLLEQNSSYNLQISDINGKLWYQQRASIYNTLPFSQFNINNLPFGLYIVTIQTADQLISKQIMLGRSF